MNVILHGLKIFGREKAANLRWLLADDTLSAIV
jgi:hypothetical protein